MNKGWSAGRSRIIFTVVIAVLVVPLWGIDRPARSEVLSIRPQGGLPTPILTRVAAAEQVQQVVNQRESRNSLWVALLGLVVVVGGALVVRTLRGQHQRIRSLESKLSAVEAGLTAKVVTLEEQLRRGSTQGRPRERI